MNNPLKIGQKITVFRVDNIMGLTHRYELMVKEVQCPMVDVACYDCVKQFAGIVCQRNKRKTHKLYVGPEDIVLNGWDVPFLVDAEAGGVFAGNCRFNFVGDPEVVIDWLENRAVFPVSEYAKKMILVNPTPITSDMMKQGTREGQPLYPRQPVAERQ